MNPFLVYLDRRILVVLFLGLVSGLPLALTLGTLSVWLTESGVDKATIGAFALTGLPYTFKFAWSPLIDRLSIPLLTRLLGRRRAWLLLTQVLLIGAIMGLGSTSPALDPGLTAIFALIVAFCSASQDIVIDAFRVEILDERSQGAGAATATLGYRIGMLISGAGALYLATYFDWSFVYNSMAALIGIGIVVTLFSHEPKDVLASTDFGKEKKGFEALALWLKTAVVDPFAEFMKRSNWLAILFFIVLYKLGDAFVSSMMTPFFIEIGFAKIEIANITKIFGFITSIVGALVGGVVISRYGVLRGLIVCGVVQMLSNLVFALQAYAGHNIEMLMVTIAVENITGGMGTAALVAYLSSLCHTSYTATQYALLSSFMSVGRTFLTAGAGVVAESMSWSLFFFFSTAVALPGMLLLLWLTRRESLRRDGESLMVTGL